jgi:hypothetical protein
MMHQILNHVSQYVEMALKQALRNEMMVTHLLEMDVQLIDLQSKQAGCAH